MRASILCMFITMIALTSCSRFQDSRDDMTAEFNAFCVNAMKQMKNDSLYIKEFNMDHKEKSVSIKGRLSYISDNAVYIDIVKKSVNKGPFGYSKDICAKVLFPNVSDIESNGLKTGEKVSLKGIFNGISDGEGYSLVIDISDPKKISTSGKEEDLYLAVKKNDYDKVRRLVLNDTDVNAMVLETTPLITACSIRSIDIRIPETLIEHGAGINTVLSDGQSPIGWAESNNNIELVQLLIRYKADVNQVINGLSIFKWHCRNAKADDEIGLILKKAGAK